MKDANTNQFYYMNFNTPLTGAGALVYENCTAVATLTPGPGGERYGFTVDYAGVPEGAVTYRGCTYDCDLPGWHEAVLVPTAVTHLDSVTIDGFTVDAPRATNGTSGFIALRGTIGTKSVSGVVINGKPL
jgi:hypothetical protein